MARICCLLSALAACSFQPGASTEPGQDLGDARRGGDSLTIAHDGSFDSASAITWRDCLDAYQHGITTSGSITIDPDGAGQGMGPYTAYCDMVSAGGGWTLVWVYTFTDYANFMAGTNGVTPRPTWDSPSNPTPSSTQIPTDPTTLGALDFPLWRSLGSEVLVTSNINHWVKCQPGAGSVVTLTTGAMSCQLVQAIAPTCQTTVPSYFDTTDPQGPGLQSGSAYLDTYYYWEGSTQGGWPTHDPCGKNGANQVNGVQNPRGAVYVRRM